ncbi:type II toxin-antitoxin system RelE/ParE family toxin [Glacieibacterium megasporae]
MGEAVPDRQPPLRDFGCESHAIYYRGIADGIFVTRVLHARMDMRRNL